MIDLPINISKFLTDKHPHEKNRTYYRLIGIHHFLDNKGESGSYTCNIWAKRCGY